MISVVSLVVELPDLAPWSLQPPIDSEAYNEIRIYSWRNFFGLSPSEDYIQQFYDWREKKRKNKIVFLHRKNRLEPYDQFFDHYVSQLGSLEEDVPIGGLLRFSEQGCPSIELIEGRNPIQEANRVERNRATLAAKPDDDPSPDGCVRYRINAHLLSPRETPIEDAVLIECGPTPWCDIAFQYKESMVSTDISIHDLENWRETIEPLRAAIKQMNVEPFPPARTRKESLQRIESLRNQIEKRKEA